MTYSSNLTDSEWESLEPLLHQILPIKKLTQSPNRNKIKILDGIILLNNFEITLVNTTTAKVDLCFIRLMLKRLAAC